MGQGWQGVAWQDLACPGQAGSGQVTTEPSWASRAGQGWAAAEPGWTWLEQLGLTFRLKVRAPFCERAVLPQQALKVRFWLPNVPNWFAQGCP